MFDSDNVPDRLPQVSERGFSDPVRLLSTSDAHWLSSHLRRERANKPPDWDKARAVVDPTIFRLAGSAPIVRRLRPLLGNDIVLWGVHGVRLRPRHRHAWHVDIETGLAEGSCISVWIGLRHCSAKSGLSLVPRSHLWDNLLQRCAADDGIGYGQATDEMILDWARRFDPSAQIVTPDIRDGEAVFFDGRIWHCARNRYLATDRHAVVLQYAPAEVAIRMPAAGSLDWPFRLKAAPRPKTILVSGRSRGIRNHIVPPPAMKIRDLTTLTTSVHQFLLPLGEDTAKGWKPYYPLFGQTGSLELLGYHVSVLSPGHCPHPPHVHPEEEILIVLDGEAEVVIADSPRDPNPATRKLTRHQASYYPAHQHHTIRNVSDAPVTYLMLRWRGTKLAAREPLPHGIFDLAGSPAPDKGFSVRALVDQPTGLLSKLHMHVSDLAPGHGYEPHADAYDLAMLVLDGEVETLDSTAGPNSMILIAAGEPHGIFNRTEKPARYLVVELHRRPDFHRDLPILVRQAGRLVKRGSRLMRRVVRKLKTHTS